MSAPPFTPRPWTGAGSDVDPAAQGRFWLRLAVSGIAVGWALALLRASGSHTGAWLLMEAHWPHAHIKLLERGTAWLLIAFAALIWIPRLTPLAPAIGLLVLANAVMGMVVGGYPFSELALATASLRILAPLALLTAWWQAQAGSSASLRLTDGLLRLGLAIVFISHGYEAWAQHPEFADYLLAVAGLAHLYPSDEIIFWILRSIAVIDVAVAAAVLVRPVFPVLAWMAFWGLVTALARPVAYGWLLFPEVIVRAPHFLVPVACFWLRKASLQKENTPDP